MRSRLALLLAATVVVAAPGSARAQHPDLGDEKPTTEVCLTCHETIKDPALKTQHKAVESGCQSCHDVQHAKVSPFLRAPVNAVCLSCHQVGMNAGMATPATLEIAPGLAVPGAFIPRARQLNLDSGGLGHPIARHPVSERPDPLRKGRALDCLSCHVPHGSQTPRLLSLQTGQGQSVCQKCHEI